MLYWLYRHAEINLFQYITLRASVAFFLAFMLTVWLMPKFIAWAKNRNASQPIYELAPSTHKHKNDTPTMGGIVFISSALLSVVLCAKLNNIYIIGALLTLALFGLIGLKDDLSKIMQGKNGAGLKPRTKFLLQCTAAVIVGALLFWFSNLTTELYVPFYKKPLFDLYFLSLFFWAFVMVSASNAVNLTDGLDGLATVPSVFSLLSLGVFVYICGNAVFSTYLLLPKVMGSGEVLIVVTSLAGALLGFLWYNCYPAQVFMGDSGSLSVGAFIGYSAVISKNEFLLIFIGFVFVMETISVILQVGSFKARKKRVFLMAPIHHHFEIKGWTENKIIVRFWIIALLSNLLALTALKIR
ncbi:MAG: phospho-N-acetylmuramoyl-pentapeptide-transferase [Campylobacteraceae bacterium]|jgi:phospho-N-acetylmuramoyl-pentapeptide-transferase|nr:phospho-N-acetylmuramoyl-pentapeptide-transferase [Campylobacteraceae bacterium]